MGKLHVDSWNINNAEDRIQNNKFKHMKIF